MVYPKLDPAKIKLIDFPDEQYVKQVFPKFQIVLHHTASGPGTDGDIKWWKMDPRKVGTAFIVGRDGEIDQCFDPKYWAGHLGTGRPNNTDLDRHSIGIEIDAWGPLVFNEGAYRSWTGAPVPNMDVIDHPMGFKTVPGGEKDQNYFYKIGASGKTARLYHRYTGAQIMAVAQLLERLSEEFDIPLFYNKDMWDLNQKALDGVPGVWTHVSYRTDKADCHPQIDLIAMLQSLTSSQHEHPGNQFV